MPDDDEVRRRRFDHEPSADARPGSGRNYLLTGLLVAVTLLLGYGDHITGPDVGFSLFYLIPIVIAAWFGGFAESLVIAVIAASCWFIADYADRSSLLFSSWNGITRLIIYGSQGWLVATLRRDRQREAVLARTDAITGLANGRAFMEEVARAAAQPTRPTGVMYLDCDDFKSVNDRFGHQAGNRALANIAAAIRTAIRSQDLAARIGGDEFAILIRDADEVTARAVARRITSAAANLGSEFAGTAFGVSAGVAIVEARPFDPESLVKAADDAMYAAKRDRKGSFVLAFLMPAAGDRG